MVFSETRGSACRHGPSPRGCSSIPEHAATQSEPAPQHFREVSVHVWVPAVRTSSLRHLWLALQTGVASYTSPPSSVDTQQHCRDSLEGPARLHVSSRAAPIKCHVGLNRCLRLSYSSKEAQDQVPWQLQCLVRTSFWFQSFFQAGRTRGLSRVSSGRALDLLLPVPTSKHANS